MSHGNPGCGIQIDSTPAVVKANSVTVKGSVRPVRAVVEVETEDSGVEVADIGSDGSFSLEVELGEVGSTRSSPARDSVAPGRLRCGQSSSAVCQPPRSQPGRSVSASAVPRLRASDSGERLRAREARGREAGGSRGARGAGGRRGGARARVGLRSELQRVRADRFRRRLRRRKRRRPGIHRPGHRDGLRHL